MIVEESEDTLALAEKVIALTASAAGLIVVTRRAWRVEENEALCIPSRYGPCFASRPTNSRNGCLPPSISPKTPAVETLHQGLSAVSLSRSAGSRTGDTLWLSFTGLNTGCAVELPANVFTGDSRWHLVTERLAD